VAEALPRDARDAMLLDGAILFSSSENIVLRRPDASAIRFPLAHAKSFSSLGTGYVQIRAEGSTYALRVDAGHEQLFLLPEPAP